MGIRSRIDRLEPNTEWVIGSITGAVEIGVLFSNNRIGIQIAAGALAIASTALVVDAYARFAQPKSELPPEG